MNIPLDRFCVNRKIAPNLTIEQFFQLVSECGINKVELRNDMNTAGVIDDLSVDQFNQLKQKYNIEVISINALYPFNIIDDSLKNKAKELIKIAQQIDSKSLVLCPFNETLSISPQEKEKLIADSVNYFNDLFVNAKVQGLIEPLGFNSSSLRSFSFINNLIQQTNVHFKLVFDTFHAYLSEVDEAEMKKINIDNIGLVHISGVTEAIERDLLADEHRVMLSPEDILKSKQQINQLEVLGYQGIYSFEPFSSQLNTWSYTDIISAIKTSIRYINE